jgi:hypothetical protein
MNRSGIGGQEPEQLMFALDRIGFRARGRRKVASGMNDEWQGAGADLAAAGQSVECKTEMR